MARLALENVTKRYGDHIVLANVNLQLQSNETVLLRGPSGSGKTTLLQLLGLLEPASSGRILLDGTNVAKLNADKRAALRLTRVGHIFQTHNMIRQLSLLENVLLPMRLANRIDEQRARNLLDTLGLQDKTDAHPHEVSIGQRQRAAVARALANNPDIILADEPTASLDDENTRIVAKHLDQERARGATILIASHDARLETVGRVIDIKNGKLDGTPSTIAT